MLFKNTNIFNLNKEEIISLFNDEKMVIEDDTINFESYGVEVVLEEGVITSIMVHKKGY